MVAGFEVTRVARTATRAHNIQGVRHALFTHTLEHIGSDTCMRHRHGWPALRSMRVSGVKLVRWHAMMLVHRGVVPRRRGGRLGPIALAGALVGRPLASRGVLLILGPARLWWCGSSLAGRILGDLLQGRGVVLSVGEAAATGPTIPETVGVAGHVLAVFFDLEGAPLLTVGASRPRGATVPVLFKF